MYLFVAIVSIKIFILNLNVIYIIENKESFIFMFLNCPMKETI